MAQPELANFDQRAVAVKLEVTEGVDVIPTAALNGVTLFDGSTGTEFDTVERNKDRPFLGGQAFGVANKRAFIEGDFELFAPPTPGVGTAANSESANHALITPGGLTVVKDAIAKTSKYNPISSGIPSASAYFWHNDHLLKIRGGRSQLSALMMQIGERFKGRLRLQGLYDAYIEENLPAVTTYTNVPVISSDTNSTSKLSVTGGVTDLVTWMKSLTVDFGSALTSRQYTGKQANRITKRDPTFSIRMARADLSDFNPWAVRDAGTIITASYKLMETSVLSSELGIRGQIEQIQPADIDGDHGWEITGRCIPSDAGGDEFYVLHKDDTP